MNLKFKKTFKTPRFIQTCTHSNHFYLVTSHYSIHIQKERKRERKKERKRERESFCMPSSKLFFNSISNQYFITQIYIICKIK